jgi:hypothetical protein
MTNGTFPTSSAGSIGASDPTVRFAATFAKAISGH